jgi:hypothetical protein
MNQLLVRTETTRFADKIIDKIVTTVVSPRYHVIGTRGFGKSTLLNYFAFRLFTELPSKKVLPVYTSFSGSAENEKDLEFIFFRSLLESLFDVPSDLQKFQLHTTFVAASNHLTSAKNEYRQKLKELGHVSLEYVSNAFENQLDHLRSSFCKIVFLIDGLDKQKTEIVLKFMRNTQERLSNLITKYGLVFIDAADPDWRETLGTKEFSGVRGVPINLRGWTLDEVQALIRNRLESIGIYKNPFDRKALEAVVEDFQGNPREILQYCTTLLHYGATERITTIGFGLVRKVVWKDASKDKFYSFIIGDNDAGYAFEKLKTIYNDRQMMNILLAVYSQRTQRLSANLDYEARSSVGITLTDDDYRKSIDILLTKGCLNRKTQNYVGLHDDLKKLFNFVTAMNESLVALPVVLSTLESKVISVSKPPKEEVVFKEEIQKVFEQHPSKWLSYKQCKEMLLEDPRTKNKFEEHFKEDSHKKISQTIPLIVHELVSEGKVMQDEESAEYRWRPHFIDSDTAEFFKAKTVLDLIESAEQAAVDGEMTNLSSLCEKLILVSLTRLNELFEGRIDTGNIVNTIDFLRNMGIETTKPISLGHFLQTLKEPLREVDEAKICVQTSILYARRIFTKIAQLRRYEPKNQDIIERIRKCKTGISKEKEREYFGKYLLPVFTEHYGKLVDCMAAMKTGDGILAKVPPELNNLLKNKQILPAEVYQCPVCKNRTAIAATSEENIKVNYCVKDKVPNKSIGTAFILSEEVYRAWNVWMEEYAKNQLEKLPFKCVESGVMLKPIDVEGVANSAEVDVIAVVNGKAIAVECMENVRIDNERNDVVDVIQKLEGLGLFDHVILFYRQVENTHAFIAEERRHGKMLIPIIATSPKNLKPVLLQTLATISGYV